jgi:hypothetical protein
MEEQKHQQEKEIPKMMIGWKKRVGNKTHENDCEKTSTSWLPLF